MVLRRGDRLWVLPSLAAFAAVALAEGMVRIDRTRSADGAIGFGGDGPAARSVLSTIAGATMTVLGVVLTITLAVLALAANAYSPRVLRTIARDTVVRIVLAVFIATFAFSLDALRLVRNDAVPSLTVTASVAFALASLGCLIALFHHLSGRIQIEAVIAEVHREAAQAIRAMPRAAAGERGVPPQAGSIPIHSAGVGRVTGIDEEQLLASARRWGASVRILVRPGDAVTSASVIGLVHGGDGDEVRREVAAAVHLGVRRTPRQDRSYGLRQLVDVALRALSPGIQDPTTAEDALVHAVDLLVLLSDRELAPRIVGDTASWVLIPGTTWEELVALVCDQVHDTLRREPDRPTVGSMAAALADLERLTADPERAAIVGRRRERFLTLADLAGNPGRSAAPAP